MNSAPNWPVEVTRPINPAMLVVAREARGLGQKELAEAAGISQGKLSKIENGLLSPGGDDLRRMANALGCTEELFYLRESIEGLGSSFLFHRQRQRVPVGLQKRIQANVNLLRIQVVRLLRGVELDFTRRFDVLNPGEVDGKPERAAELVRVAWRLPAGPVADVTALIESAGGVVLKCDFDTPLIDAAHFWLPGLPPLFFVNRDLPGDRLRWTLAHELGHAFLHQHYAGEDVEDEADRFAGEFLMPKREIVPHLRDLTIERAAALKPYWKVSMAALVRQAHRHKCITNWKYRDLNISLSTQGYKKVEPFPIPVEEPKLIREVVKVYRTNLGYDNFDLAKLVLTADSQFFVEGTGPRLMRVDGKPFYAFPASA